MANAITHMTLDILTEARETVLYYLNKYRFDPFMRDEHNAQLDKLNKLIKQIEEINNA